MYILLTGTKKNIGDFLIADRSKKLLKHERPERQIVEMKSWEPLDAKIDQINSSEAIIIHGGPGYQPNMYPGVYPLIKDLTRITVPIIPMALGWKGNPGDDLSLRSYSFNSSSVELLKTIHSSCEFSSCRDYLTQRVLAKYGFENTIMTGCSTWYDIEYLGKEFKPPQKINKIAFTSPQRSLYKEQAIDLLRHLQKKFPETEIICSFHRGIEQDEYTDKKDAKNLKEIIKMCESMGFKFEDISYDLSKLSLYDDCDIHIGYRLHGHLLFLSRRKPSFLINEDGRGRGAQEALGLLSINGFARNPINTLVETTGLSVMSKLLDAINLFGKKNSASNFAEDNLISFLIEEIDNGFERFYGVFKLIDNHYKKMKKFLNSLP